MVHPFQTVLAGGRAHRRAAGTQRLRDSDAQTTAYVGVEHPAPTLPSEVVVLRTEPLRPHVRLGEILIDASVDPAPPITEVEEKLREETAKLGGDAVVVVYDHIQAVGAYVNGPLWARDV